MMARQTLAIGIGFWFFTVMPLSACSWGWCWITTDIDPYQSNVACQTLRRQSFAAQEPTPPGPNNGNVGLAKGLKCTAAIQRFNAAKAEA